MSEASVRVPEISELHDGREVDCVTTVRNGITYYRQRVETLEYNHQMLHDGRYFSGGYFNAAVLNNAVIELLVQSSATVNTHMQFSGSCGGDSTIQLFEGATFSNAGAAVTISNHNRQSVKVGDGMVTHTPTLLTDGATVNGIMFVPGGQKAQSGGGAGGFVGEFILQFATTYLVRMTNLSGQTKPMSLMVAGYQPTL